METQDPRVGNTIEVEVVLAQPTSLWRTALQLPVGACVADALKASDVAEQLGGRPLADFAVGIFSRVCGIDSTLADGDRVEIYRPLTADPKEARRQRVRRRSG